MEPSQPGQTPRYRVPDELRETLLDFTIAYLLERPTNLPAFGLNFFQKLKNERNAGGGRRSGGTAAPLPPASASAPVITEGIRAQPAGRTAGYPEPTRPLSAEAQSPGPSVPAPNSPSTPPPPPPPRTVVIPQQQPAPIVNVAHRVVEQNINTSVNHLEEAHR